MPIAEEYRQHAAACLRASEAARGAHAKAMLGAMAQRWNEAAERAERFAMQVADWKELAPIGEAQRPSQLR